MSINRACQMLGFSKQAYHKGCRNMRNKSQRQFRAKEYVLEKVTALRRDMPRIGTRKLHFMMGRDLAKAGIQAGRDKVFSILRDANMLVKKKRKRARTTDSSQWRKQYPNLVKEVVPQRPEEIWVADITYFETEEEGFVYGHLVSDAYSKKIMGYALAADMSAATTLKAFEMAQEFPFPLMEAGIGGS